MKGTNLSQRVEFLSGLVRAFIALLVLSIGLGIFFLSLKYLDPNFNTGYFANRDANFLSVFRIAVIVHSISATLILLLSTPMVFFRFEKKRPSLHRIMGKIVFWCSIILLVPSWYILSNEALGGISGKTVFFGLTTLTMISLWQGVKSAQKKKYGRHKRWMIRFYILLTSAIWLRINLFLLFILIGTVTQEDYILAAILSWIPQLIIAEILFKAQQKK